MTRAFVTLAFLTGCVNEYHPEYHPVSIVSVEQRAFDETKPRTSEPDYSKMFSAKEDPFAVAAPVPTAALLDPTFPSRSERQGVRIEPTARPGVYIGRGVQINGNVTINGDVYIDSR